MDTSRMRHPCATDTPRSHFGIIRRSLAVLWTSVCGGATFSPCGPRSAMQDGRNVKEMRTTLRKASHLANRRYTREET